MSMFVDLRHGESVIAFRRGDETCRMTITLEKKLGNACARISIAADPAFVLVPPNKQRAINTTT